MQRLKVGRQRLVEVTFPEQHDDLTEKAVNENTHVRTPLGVWEAYGENSGYGCAVDTLEKVSGLKSVEFITQAHLHPPFSHVARCIFDSPVDLSGYSKIHFWHRTDDKFDANSWCCFLWDDALHFSFLQFGTHPNVWEEKWWDLSLFVTMPNFKWNAVKEVAITNGNPSVAVPPQERTWIDDLFFWGTVSEGVLRVESSPFGKTGTMTYGGQTYPFTTPAEVRLPVGKEVTIAMDPSEFLQWQDGETSPTRTVVMQLGTQIYKAFYSTATLPLLSIKSIDQNGNNFPAQQAIKVVYGGAEQVVDVPFSARVSKGTYTLAAIPAGNRALNFWKLPSGAESKDAFITFDVQADTEVEIHWLVSAFPWEWLVVGGVVLIGIAGIALMGGRE
jgi:hypothetical protein